MKDFERKAMLSQLIHNSTRITNRVKSTIDLIFTDMTYISESGILPISISDHLPVYLIKKKSRPVKSFRKIKGRSYKNYDKDLFGELLMLDKGWGEFWHAGNTPNILWDIMLKIIRRTADKMCPLVNIRIRDGTPGWYTREVIEQVNLKKVLTNEVRKSNTVLNYGKLLDCKRKLGKMLRKAKQELIVSSLNENRNNPRRFWRILNEDLGLNSKKGIKSCTRLHIDTDTNLSGADVGDYLSEYYASNGKKSSRKNSKLNLSYF